MTDNFQEKFNEVKRSYIRNLRDKQDTIHRLWQKLKKEWSIPAYDELHIIVHSIAGSAETFGFPEITSTARNVVNQLRDIKGYSDISTEQIASLERALEKLTMTIAPITGYAQEI